jgi:hypothetical protein
MSNLVIGTNIIQFGDAPDFGEHTGQLIQKDYSIPHNPPNETEFVSVRALDRNDVKLSEFAFRRASKNLMFNMRSTDSMSDYISSPDPRIGNPISISNFSKISSQLEAFFWYQQYNYDLNGNELGRTTITQARIMMNPTSLEVSVATAPVPEPATWALMIGGFGMAGTMLRRRRALTA